MNERILQVVWADAKVVSMAIAFMVWIILNWIIRLMIWVLPTIAIMCVLLYLFPNMNEDAVTAMIFLVTGAFWGAYNYALDLPERVGGKSIRLQGKLFDFFDRINEKFENKIHSVKYPDKEEDNDRVV